MRNGRRRRRIEPTDDWEQLKLLCRWPEQSAYEEIRPLVLFGMAVAGRAKETGSSERTLYRKISRFGSEGMDSLFASEGARRRALSPPPASRSCSWRESGAAKGLPGASSSISPQMGADRLMKSGLSRSLGEEGPNESRYLGPRPAEVLSRHVATG